MTPGASTPGLEESRADAGPPPPGGAWSRGTGAGGPRGGDGVWRIPGSSLLRAPPLRPCPEEGGGGSGPQNAADAPLSPTHLGWQEVGLRTEPRAPGRHSPARTRPPAPSQPGSACCSPPSAPPPTPLQPDPRRRGSRPGPVVSTCIAVWAAACPRPPSPGPSPPSGPGPAKTRSFHSASPLGTFFPPPPRLRAPDPGRFLQRSALYLWAQHRAGAREAGPCSLEKKSPLEAR